MFVKLKLFLKAFLIVLFLSTFLAVTETPAKAQSTKTLTNPPQQPYYQPTPQIIAPQTNTTLSGVVAIKIYIEPTVTQKMEVYANSLFLGMAQPLDSSHWFFNWHSTNFPNGQYQLMARATIITTVGYPIDTFSEKVAVNITNQKPNTQPDTPSTEEESSSGTQEETQSSENTTQEDVTEENSEETNQTTTKSQEIAKEESPYTLRTVATITFPKTSANQLEKIEYKVDKRNQEFLVFSGVAMASSQITLKIYSQPIVISTKSTSDGKWEYIFEKPLEPGNHKVEVEIIQPNGTKVNSGPFEFLIARASGSAYNPTGASLELVDPLEKTYQRYFVIVASLILISFVILLFIQKRKFQKLAKGE